MARGSKLTRFAEIFVGDRARSASSLTLLLLLVALEISSGSSVLLRAFFKIESLREIKESFLVINDSFISYHALWF